MDNYERNGLGTLFKEIKSSLKILILDDEHDKFSRRFKKGRYDIYVSSANNDNLEVTLIKDKSKKSGEIAITDGLEKLTIEETENLLKIVLKELIVSSNFNKYNKRRYLDFYSNVETGNIKSSITVGVRNKMNQSLRIDYWG